MIKFNQYLLENTVNKTKLFDLDFSNHFYTDINDVDGNIEGYVIIDGKRIETNNKDNYHSLLREIEKKIISDKNLRKYLEGDDQSFNWFMNSIHYLYGMLGLKISIVGPKFDDFYLKKTFIGLEKLYYDYLNSLKILIKDQEKQLEDAIKKDPRRYSIALELKQLSPYLKQKYSNVAMMDKFGITKNDEKL